MWRLSPRSSSRAGPRGPAPDPLRPRRPPGSRVCTAASRRSGGPLPDYGISLGRTIGLPMNGAVSNLSSSPADGACSATSCAAAATTWSTCTSRTCRWSAGSPPRRARCPTVGHLPHLLHGPRVSNHVAANVVGARRLYNKLQRADRRVRGRGVDRPPLLRRPLPDRPQRRGPGRRPARAARPATTSRSSSSAAPRGARACPSCCAPSRRCAAPAWARGYDRRRPRRGGRAAAARPRGRDMVGPRDRGGEVAPARRGRPALRAVARRRELRHGADRGVRVRHAGRRLRHRGLPRRGPRTASTACWCPRGDPVELGEALRDLALDPARRERMAARRPRARRALRLAARGRRGDRGLRGGGRLPRRSRPAAPRGAPRASDAAAPSPGRAAPAARLPSLEPERRPPRPARAPRAGSRARAVVGGRRRRGVGLDRAGARAARASSRSAARCWPPRPSGCWSRFALMCASMLAARRGLARDPARGAAGHARAPARHRARAR